MGSERSSDEQWLERFRDGDREAFSALYRAHHAMVFRFAVYMTGDPTKAGEITHDVFVWLLHHPHAFDAGKGDLAPFLRGVARKLLLRGERTGRRWLPLPGNDREDPHDTELAAVQSLDAGILRQAIALLPSTYREAVVLCDLENQTYEEAAAALGCAVGTIRSRLHRARELLARRFQHKRNAHELRKA